VREARRRVGPSAPLHLVGFSNGGALAVKYALDSISDPQLTRADRVVLISPMIGITRFARFAGLASLPALLPAFAKAAWLGVVPEFNPFKYNSFPVNGAVQSFRLTQVLQRQIALYSRTGQLVDLPPIITFQSVMDFTVSTSAIITALYSHLPANGSELVLFDVNRTVNSVHCCVPPRIPRWPGFCPAERGTTGPRSLPMPMSPAAKKSSAASRPAAWPKSIVRWALPIRTAFFHSLTSRCRFR
jgi:alpha-beta hydrolase superfamily lysophospholipase